MDGTTAHIEVPGTPPEDAVWQLAAADVGSNAAMLAIGIAVVWRAFKSMIDKMLATSTKAAEAADARAEKLLGQQSAALDGLTTAVNEVKIAVVRSDLHNQAAIASLRDHLQRHDARLDRVDVRLDAHGERITGLEHSTGSGVRRVPRTGGGQG